MDMLD